MGVYAVDYYGRTHYGPSASPYLSTWSVLWSDVTDGVVTMWLDYTHLRFGSDSRGGWTIPAAALQDTPQAVDLRIVRNGFNTPDDENDGLIVLQQGVLGSRQFTDTVDPTSAGKFLYYSFFVSDLAGVWHRAGDIIRLVPQDWFYCERLYNLLPQYYRDQDDLLIDAQSTATTRSGDRPARTSGPLQRFLCMIGFQFDQIRTEYESLRLQGDAFHMSGGLLPALLDGFGFNYEPEMGMHQSRVLAENLIHLYKIKGTRAGIEGVASSVTGYGTEVALGTNFALDPASIDFHTSVTTTKFNIRYNEGDGAFTVDPSIPGAHPTAVPPVTVGPGVPYPMTAYWIPTAGPSSVITFSSLNGGSPQSWGFPVETLQGKTIVFSIYAWGLAAQSYTVDLKFYDRQGNLITTSSVASTTALALETWGRIASGAAVVPADVLTGGSITTQGAAWCEATILTDTVAPDSPIYLSMEQIEVSSGPSAYQPPRDIRITLFANRVNRVRNPSFESNTTAHWAAGTNTTLAATTAKSYAVPGSDSPGTHSGMLTSTAAGAMQVYTDLMPATEGLLYNASGFFLTDAVPQYFTISMVFFDISSAALLTVTSAPMLDSTTWQRSSVAMNARHPAPVGTVGVEVVINYLSTSGAGEKHYIDCIMLEQSLSVGPYFDSGLYTSSDYRWAGTANLSESLYYKRYSTKIMRLAQILSGKTTNVGGAPRFANGFIPAGMTYTLALQSI